MSFRNRSDDEGFPRISYCSEATKNELHDFCRCTLLFLSCMSFRNRSDGKGFPSISDSSAETTNEFHNFCKCTYIVFILHLYFIMKNLKYTQGKDY